MKILKIHPETPQQRLINQVLEHLNRGGLLIYPTDTCYGIGCSIMVKKAIDEIYRIKRMPEDKLLSFICSDLKHISHYAVVSNLAYKLMRKLLPGPYTFVLPSTKEVPKLLQSKRKQVGIRMPDQPVILEIVRQLGHPIVTTACQLEGDEEPCHDIHEVRERMGGLVEMAIDGDYIFPEFSTVVRIEDEQIEIIRQGKGDTAIFSQYPTEG